MIPVAGAVRVGDYRVHGFRLSIPFLSVVACCATAAGADGPVLFIGSLLRRLDPFTAVGAVLRVLAALRGTHVEVMNDNFSCW